MTRDKAFLIEAAQIIADRDNLNVTVGDQVIKPWRDERKDEMSGHIHPEILANGDYQVGGTKYHVERDCAIGGFELSIFPVGAEPYMKFIKDSELEILLPLWKLGKESTNGD